MELILGFGFGPWAQKKSGSIRVKRPCHKSQRADPLAQQRLCLPIYAPPLPVTRVCAPFAPPPRFTPVLKQTNKG
jgi:hypothetical protein